MDEPRAGRIFMQFVIRIEHNDGVWQEPNVTFEEWDTIKLAEQRATTLRKQGAHVEIYQHL
jgi:hypothetical protein